MRITCPSCAAAYDVPEERLRPGKSVRCAGCGETWAPAAAVADAAAEPAVAAAPPRARPASETELDAGAETPPAPKPSAAVAPKPASQGRRNPPLIAAWAATAAIILAGAYVAGEYRAQVMRAWPPSERAYAMLGLGPSQPAP